MINFLHTYEPSRILFELGPFTLYWYGFFYVVALMIGIVVTAWIAKRRSVVLPNLIDLAVWLFVGGIISARVWYVFLIEPLYFWSHPLETIAIWNGGLAIHGGIVGAVLVLWYWTKKRKQNFLQVADILIPALALGQAIGRWGNYFNQELFGAPTDVAWGIPIEFGAAAEGVISTVYFHPTFLYESIGNGIIFALMVWLVLRAPRPGRVVALYLVLYSVLRFGLEFVRIDPTPTWIFRLPQWVSLLVIIAVIAYLAYDKRKYDIET